MPKLHVVTYGCQMNAHDSDRMVELMEPLGFEPTANREEADFIVLNTCSVREKADQKMLSELGRLREWRQGHGERILAVGGCVAQGMGQGLLNKVPFLDLVFGTDQLAALPDMVRRISRDRVRVAAVDWRDADEFDFLPIRPRGKVEGCHAFVKIMKGCNQFCTYCIVPYVKGRELCRPADEIVDEVRMLVERHGVREVTLLGQTVTSYNVRHHARPGAPRFSELLARIHEIEGLARIRFMTGYPKDVEPDLIEAFRDLPRVASHIHMPVQSGSDPILKRMNRGYDRQLYVDRMAALREARPGLALTSDIIVGFPGETEADFEATLDLVARMRYDSIFSFSYSERPGTRAADFEDSVPHADRRRRLNELNQLQERITREILESRVGRREEVLVLGPSSRDPAILSGRTSEHRTVNFSGDAQVGDLVEVEITEAKPHSLRGRLAGGSQRLSA